MGEALRYSGVMFCVFVAMVNASLNWASIVGLVLCVAALPGAVSAGFQIAFLLGRRKDTSGGVIVATIWRFLCLFIRLIFLPMVGLLFFFQGWRLDPILQFGIFLLSLLYLSELSMSMLYEYGSWQKRKQLSSHKKLILPPAGTDLGSLGPIK